MLFSLHYRRAACGRKKAAGHKPPDEVFLVWPAGQKKLVKWSMPGLADSVAIVALSVTVSWDGSAVADRQSHQTPTLPDWLA
jgi:hypothetical protein